MKAQNSKIATFDAPSALELLKSMQGTKQITVPLILNEKVLHEGIVFDVGIFEYNHFLNESQNQKISVTNAAANFLKRCVSDDDKDILNEAIKVPGLLDFFMGVIIPKVQPEIAESLD